MGMFDEFHHPCPRCGTTVEWQSKAGECRLATFTQTNCPADVAGDLHGQSAVCRSCGRVLSISTQALIHVEAIGG